MLDGKILVQQPPIESSQNHIVHVHVNNLKYIIWSLLSQTLTWNIFG
jgi:hypothetical protein